MGLRVMVHRPQVLRIGVLATLVLLALGAAFALDRLTGPAHGPGASPTEPQGSPSASPTLLLSVRGNEVVPIGEPAAMTVATGDSPGTLDLTVHGLEVITECPGRGAPVQAPSQGFFLVLDVTADFEADGTATPAPDAFAPLGAEAFGIASPDGTVQEVTSTEASWACFEDDELLPPFVGVGESVSGKVVLDSASEHGAVFYVPEGAVGVEWVF